MRIEISRALLRGELGELNLPCPEATTIQKVAISLDALLADRQLKFPHTYMILINDRRIAGPLDRVTEADKLSVIPVIQGG